MTALATLSDHHHPSTNTRQQQTRLASGRVAQLVAEYQAGADMNTLAHTYGVHRHSVRNHLSKAGVEVRRLGLTEPQVTEAVRLYLAGQSLAKLGETFGCDHTTVRRALLKHGLVMRKPW